MLTASAGHAAGSQVVHGKVLVPTPGRGAGVSVESCPGLLDANVGFVTGASIRYRFTVNGSTWGQPFSVTPAKPIANIDIAFRKATGPWIAYQSKGFDAEQGFVPNGAIEAAVCLNIGAPTKFTYRAGPGA